MKIKHERILKHPLLYILIAAFFARLCLLLNPGIVWWDSAVYIGVGKYIFSAGAVGVNEAFRPLLLPLILGLAWKLGISPYYFGMAFDLALNLFAIFLTFIIAEKIIGRRAAVFAAIFMAISPSLIFYSSKVLTENLTIVLMLLSVYFAIEKKYACAGLFAGISVLARYPQGLMLPALLVFALFIQDNRKKLADSAKLTAFFAIPLAGLALYNLFAFGSIFYQFAEAQEVITKVGSMISSPWTFYFGAVFIECFLSVLFLYALYLSWKEKNRDMWLLNIIFIFFFIYYSTVSRKEIRYLIVVLPMLYIALGHVFARIWHKRLFEKKHAVKYVTVALIILFAVSSFFNIAGENRRFYRPADAEIMDNFYMSPLIQGKTVISSSPNVIAYSDLRVIVMEPSVYYSYLNMTADYFMIYTCDLFCQDQKCASTRSTFLSILSSTKNLAYKKEMEHCSYLLYENN